MDSIVISPKRLQAIIFLAFSRQLSLDGNHIEGKVEKEKFTWQVIHQRKSGESVFLGMIYEIPRSAEFARFQNDVLFLVESYNPELLIKFFSYEWGRFVEQYQNEKQKKK